jgi:hypothetical protein
MRLPKFSTVKAGVVLIVTGVIGVAATDQATQEKARSRAAAAPAKTTDCRVRGPLPDAACTPGVTLRVTRVRLCKAGYSGTVRNVSAATKRQVYEKYLIAEHAPGQYEIDHLIPLELGGSNDVKNLWPEGNKPVPGFHQKDGIENRERTAVCSGGKDLRTVQHQIAKDWTVFLAP